VEDDESSVQVAKAFARFLRTGDSSLVKRFTLQEMEKALLRYRKEKAHPIYRAMEKRAAEMREGQRHRQEGVRKWQERVVGFIAGLTVALLILLLRRYVFSP
jgi:hypothetical protein